MFSGERLGKLGIVFPILKGAAICVLSVIYLCSPFFKKYKLRAISRITPGMIKPWMFV